MAFHGEVEHVDDLDGLDRVDGLPHGSHLLVTLGEDAELVDHRALEHLAEVDLSDVRPAPTVAAITSPSLSPPSVRRTFI